MASISIITPSFNQSTWLGNCLESVASQRMAPLEHVIYDPGSTDGSRQLAASHANAHSFVTLVAEPDDGQVDAINRGLAAATGDVLTWLNSDDWFIDDQVLERVAEAFDANPDVDVVYGRGEYVDPTGNPLKDAFVQRDADNLPKHLHESIGILQPALFFRRSLFERVGGLNPYYNLSLDYDYWVRFAVAGAKFMFVDRKFARATMHEDSKTVGSRGPQYKEILELQQEHFGEPHSSWIDRWALYRATGRDGILNNSSELTVGQQARYRVQDQWIRQAYRTDAPRGTTATIVTSFDRHYFEQGLTLIAALHREAATSVDRILVYDLGLTGAQREELSSLELVRIVDYPEETRSLYDGYLEPKNYSYKCAAILDAGSTLDDGDLVLWVDAGVVPLQPLGSVLEIIEHDEVFFVDHDDRPIWPLYNITFTADEAIVAMEATAEELLAPHLCSCLVGYRKGGRYQALFEDAYRYSADPDAIVWPKHLDDPVRAPTDQDAENSRQAIVASSSPTADTAELRRLFGYLGHRQDQSVYSILAARYGAPLQSARKFCRANDGSSVASKKNWESGGFSEEVSVSRENLDEITDDAVSYHHRGTYVNLDGLRRSSRTSDCLFVLGNGPSLGGIDLEVLRGHDTIGLNAAYRYWDEINWYPTYYACMDSVVVVSHADEIARFVRESDANGIQRFFLRSSILDSQPQLADHPRVSILESEIGRISGMDVEPVTTGSHCLLWGRALGYTRVFLLGIDLGYVEQLDESEIQADGTLAIEQAPTDNPNYFFAGYQQAGDRYNIPNPNPGLHGRAWQAVKAALPPQVDVVNLNPDSELTDFPFGSLEDALHEAATTAISNCSLWPGIGSATEDPVLVGPFERGAASLEEVHLIRSVFHRSGVRSGVMVDVGAHVGGSLHRFAEDGWKILAFEPDPANRKELLGRVSEEWDVSIDVRAVSNIGGKRVSFFASPESTGVSGLEPFLGSHKEVAEVETVVLSSFADERGVDEIDFLKIDTEGHDLNVLEGVPWERWRPRIVLSEFEDRKTMRVGYQTGDLIRFLRDRGYVVLVSEWHPVVRYGVSHDFRSIRRWDGSEFAPDVWGNVVAFRSAEDADEFVRLVEEKLGDAALERAGSPTPVRQPPRAGIMAAVKRRLRGSLSLVKRIRSRKSTIARRLLRWYLSPSGVLFLGALGLGALAVAGAPGARWLGHAAFAAAAVFVPYKFGREQVRGDRRLQVAQAGTNRGVGDLRDEVRSAQRSNTERMEASQGAMQARIDTLSRVIDERLVQHQAELARFTEMDRARQVAMERVATGVRDSLTASVVVAADRSDGAPSAPMSVETSRDDILLGRRSIFCAASGRSGTHYLANLLSAGEYVHAVHEAAPFMTGHHLRSVMERPLHETYSERRVKADAIRATLSTMPSHMVYAETNHMFIKTFQDVVVNEFDQRWLSVVVLRRSLDLVLKSLLNLGYFTAGNDDWRQWMHLAHGEFVLAKAPGAFEELDDVDRAIGYLFDIEARQQKFVESHPDLNVVEVGLDEIRPLDGARDLLTRLRVKPTARLEQVAGQASNQRATSKLAGWDLAEMRRRIVDYRNRAEGEGLWVPEIEPLLSESTG